MQKYCFLVKLHHFSQKRSLQQSHCRGRKQIGFLESKKWSSLLEQNPTLIYLRNVKSFVFRAGRKVPHCQKWDCHALPLFALDRVISRLFSISILIAGETKNGRAKSTRWSVWQSCFGVLRHSWPDVFFYVGLGSGSFCHDWAWHCSVLSWFLGASFVFGTAAPP